MSQIDRFMELLFDSEDTSIECQEIDWVENGIVATGVFTSGDKDSEHKPKQTEVPDMQSRFQAVLKRRLQMQIESHPPMFPWETEVSDYPDTLSLTLTWSEKWGIQQSIESNSTK